MPLGRGGGFGPPPVQPGHGVGGFGGLGRGRGIPRPPEPQGPIGIAARWEALHPNEVHRDTPPEVHMDPEADPSWQPTPFFFPDAPGPSERSRPLCGARSSRHQVSMPGVSVIAALRGVKERPGAHDRRQRGGAKTFVVCALAGRVPEPFREPEPAPFAHRADSVEARVLGHPTGAVQWRQPACLRTRVLVAASVLGSAIVVLSGAHLGTQHTWVPSTQ